MTTNTQNHTKNKTDFPLMGYVTPNIYSFKLCVTILLRDNCHEAFPSETLLKKDLHTEWSP